MPLSQDERERLAKLVHSENVVLFMKGSRHFPQCGFSATVVGILDKLVPKYQTVNVLSDPAVRDGIKEYSQWPTIPQLYVKGEFVGGCDIVKEMYASGELQKLLGVEEKKAPPPKPPSITISASAAKAFRDAAAEAGDDVLRLEVDRQFQNDLYFGPKKADDLVVETAGFRVHFDPESAARADGVSIDFVEAGQQSGFRITNPQEPPRVKPLRANELKAMKDRGEAFELFDVRTDKERETAKIAFAHPLDRAGQERLMALPKDAKVVFHCHHGMRSRQAAEQALRSGFTNVYNLEGGIDAWSTTVDSTVPRY